MLLAETETRNTKIFCYVGSDTCEKELHFKSPTQICHSLGLVCDAFVVVSGVSVCTYESDSERLQNSLHFSFKLYILCEIT